MPIYRSPVQIANKKKAQTPPRAPFPSPVVVPAKPEAMDHTTPDLDALQLHSSPSAVKHKGKGKEYVSPPSSSKRKRPPDADVMNIDDSDADFQMIPDADVEAELRKERSRMIKEKRRPKEARGESLPGYADDDDEMMMKKKADDETHEGDDDDKMKRRKKKKKKHDAPGTDGRGKKHNTRHDTDMISTQEGTYQMGSLMRAMDTFYHEFVFFLHEFEAVRTTRRN